jgi:hypothetical protein
MSVPTEQVHRECKDPRAAASGFITNKGQSSWYGQTLTAARGEDAEELYIGICGQVIDPTEDARAFQLRRDYDYGNEELKNFKAQHVDVEMPDRKGPFCAPADDAYRQRSLPKNKINPGAKYSLCASFDRTLGSYAGSVIIWGSTVCLKVSLAVKQLMKADVRQTARNPNQVRRPVVQKHLGTSTDPLPK